MKLLADNKVRKPALLVAVLLLLTGALFFLAGRESAELPPEILGEWYSSDPRYQACFLDISRESLVIGAADGNVYYYTLTGITEELAATGQESFFTLHCRDDEGMALDFRLRYDRRQNLLSYRNQREVIWFKAVQR
ncbi:hypothetical protein ACHHRT_01300 [Desulfurivibrio sp. D14AmB]|uniref:hypothetical protein n=1 Tax=Desulfurivibrio sp. D14AmB TaxID=3374370 RepID=UPI00376EA3F7